MVRTSHKGEGPYDLLTAMTCRSRKWGRVQPCAAMRRSARWRCWRRRYHARPREVVAMALLGNVEGPRQPVTGWREADGQGSNSS
jgi:hypothetical protein